MAGELTQGQKDLEKRLGMSIWEIREKVLSLPNDERWRYMRENGISGGLIYLAPSQYPRKPKKAVWIEETLTDGHQITMDEWAGTFEHRLRTPKRKEAEG